jgi:hypothetical protein
MKHDFSSVFHHLHNFPHFLHLESRVIVLKITMCIIRRIIISNFNQHNNIRKRPERSIHLCKRVGEASQNGLWSGACKLSVWTVLTNAENLLVLRWTTDIWISALHRAECSPWLLFRPHQYSVCLHPKKSVWGVGRFTVAKLRLIHTQLSVTMPCRQGFILFSHLIHKVRSCSIHTYHAMPMPRHCRAPTMSFWKRLLKAMARHGMECVTISP